MGVWVRVGSEWEIGVVWSGCRVEWVVRKGVDEMLGVRLELGQGWVCGK